MKRLLYFFATLLVCCTVSCTKETPDSSDNSGEAPVLMKVVTLSASVDDAETKSLYTYEGNVARFSWTEGDSISVVCTDGRFYTFIAQGTGKSVDFTGEIPMDEDLGAYAYFPADPNHEVGKFHLPAVKYSGESFSADLPMAATIINRTCEFQHMTGAAHLRFTGFADDVDSAKISIVNPSLKISGLYPIKTQDGVMVYDVSSISNESEGRFIRTVPVVNNEAQLYLPYPANPNNGLWATSDITIVGYVDGQGTELLNRTMKGFSPFVRGQIIPCTPLALPIEIPGVNWDNVNWGDATKVASYTNTSAADLNVKELRSVADMNYMYLRIVAKYETPFFANFLDVSFCDGEGTNSVWDRWTTTGTATYWKEHKGTIAEDGKLTSMQYQHNGSYEPIQSMTEFSSDEVTWYLAYPREFVDIYKNSKGTAYVSCLLWKDYGSYWACPQKDTAMLEVTLPFS